MKTQGEMENQISEAMVRMAQEYLGRGPSRVRAHVVQDMIVIRFSGTLSRFEQHMAEPSSTSRGIDLLKQMRQHLLDIARPGILQSIQEITGVGVHSVFHDICANSGEEVLVVSLAAAPVFRDVRRTRLGDRVGTSGTCASA